MKKSFGIGCLFCAVLGIITFSFMAILPTWVITMVSVGILFFAIACIEVVLNPITIEEKSFFCHESC